MYFQLLSELGLFVVCALLFVSVLQAFIPMSVQSLLRAKAHPAEALEFPLSESIEALAYSVAWHMLSSSTLHYSEAGQEAARHAIPRLVASRGAMFEDVLRFCQCLLGGLYDMTAASLRNRRSAMFGESTRKRDGNASSSDWRVERAALKILVESSLDVVTMLSTQRESSCASSASSSPCSSPAHPPTPSKALSASSPRKPTSAEQGTSSMANLCTPHTLLNLLMCAYLDSTVALILTDVLGERHNTKPLKRSGTGEAPCAPSAVLADGSPASSDNTPSGRASAAAGGEKAEDEEDATNAFFAFSMIAGTDPDELLEKFLEYMRAAPYPLRLVWEHSALQSSCNAAPDGESVAPWNPEIARTTWASSSRRLMLQRSVTGKLLETAGPSAPDANALVSRLWRYVV